MTRRRLASVALLSDFGLSLWRFVVTTKLYASEVLRRPTHTCGAPQSQGPRYFFDMEHRQLCSQA